MSTLSFVQMAYDRNGRNGLSGEEGVGNGGTMAPQVSVSKKPWFQDKLWGTLAHWIWPRLLSKHFINFWFHSHMSCFFRLAYQSRASKHKNWKALEVLTLSKIFKNANEKLERLNSFQKLIFNQQSAAPQKVPPGARGLPFASPLPKPLRCIRDVRVLVRFTYLWCLHHYNCVLFIMIPPVTDMHVVLKKSNAKEEFGRQNVAKERLSVIYTFR